MLYMAEIQDSGGTRTITGTAEHVARQLATRCGEPDRPVAVWVWLSPTGDYELTDRRRTRSRGTVPDLQHAPRAADAVWAAACSKAQAMA